MTYCSVVTVLVLVGLTKKRSGHYAILKILSLTSPSVQSMCSSHEGVQYLHVRHIHSTCEDVQYP